MILILIESIIMCIVSHCILTMHVTLAVSVFSMLEYVRSSGGGTLKQWITLHNPRSIVSLFMYECVCVCRPNQVRHYTTIHNIQ